MSAQNVSVALMVGALREGGFPVPLRMRIASAVPSMLLWLPHVGALVSHPPVVWRTYATWETPFLVKIEVLVEKTF